MIFNNFFRYTDHISEQTGQDFQYLLKNKDHVKAFKEQKKGYDKKQKANRETYDKQVDQEAVLRKEEHKNVINPKNNLIEIRGVRLDLSRAVEKKAGPLYKYTNPWDKKYLAYLNGVLWENMIGRNLGNVDISKVLAKDELTPYDIKKLYPFLAQTNSTYEDTQFSHEITALIQNPTVLFRGKRNRPVVRTDENRFSTRSNLFVDTSHNLVVDPFRAQHESIAELHDRLVNQNRVAEHFHLNDLLYDDYQFYKRLFTYGISLTSLGSTSNSYLSVITKKNLGNNIQQFYKQMDSNIFSKLFDNDPDINPTRLLRFLKGESSGMEPSVTFITQGQGPPQTPVKPDVTDVTDQIEQGPDDQSGPSTPPQTPGTPPQTPGTPLPPNTPSLPQAPAVPITPISRLDIDKQIMETPIPFRVEHINLRLPTEMLVVGDQKVWINENENQLRVGDFIITNKRELLQVLGYSNTYNRIYVAKLTDRDVVEGGFQRKSKGFYRDIKEGSNPKLTKVVFDPDGDRAVRLRDLIIATDTTFEREYDKIVEEMGVDPSTAWSGRDRAIAPSPRGEAMQRSLLYGNNPNNVTPTVSGSGLSGGVLDSQTELGIWNSAFFPKSLKSLGAVGNDQSMWLFTF